ncbi:PAS domain S-box protein [Synechococcus sp. Nb3U1]|nr:PAS domain S-box protein [Synechococcus sp. Nb3U1]
MAMSLRVQNSFREREAKLNLVLAAGEMGTWQRDLCTDPERQQWSAEVYRQLGLNPEQVPQPTRQTFLNRVHPEDLHLFEKFDWLQEEESRPFQREFRIIRPNGEIRWIRSFIQTIKNYQGKRIQVFGINKDITQEKQQEAEQQARLQALRISEARLKALIDNLPFQFWARDSKDILIYQSKSDQEQYGNCLGQRIEDMNLSEEDILDWQDTVAKIKTGEFIKREKKVCCDEEEKHLLFIGAPIRQEDQIIGSLGVHVDITEQRRAEANLVQARSQLEIALKGGNMGVWEADLITSKMWWSPEQYHILGFVSDEHGHVLDPQGQVVAPYPIRELIFNRILPSAQKECQDNIEKALSTGHYPDSEYPYIRPDGELRWLLFRGKLDSDDSGQVRRLLGACIDITDRKHTELQLELLASIVHSSIDAIVSTDLKGVILTWNEGAERTYGYLAEEVIGINIRDILILEHGFPPEDSFISQHRSKEGRLIDVFVTISILKSVRGDPCGTSWIIRDISYQKELDRLKDEFISVVSHELRTPLTAIHGSLTTLNTGIFGSLQPMGQELLHIAEQNITRLIRLVNDILDLERLNNPDLPLDRQPCRCAELVAQACATMQPLAEQAQIQIQQTLTDCTFWADPDLIVQVLTNLLSNAIKFSPPHSSIHISAQPQQDTLLIAVRNQGPGIPADKLELIFERFQQVDASDSRKKGGTGLGLAICRQIVQQHQGRIWAESRLGEGNIFYIALPLRDPR